LERRSRIALDGTRLGTIQRSRMAAVRTTSSASRIP
jgi:hypothetical protein